MLTYPGESPPPCVGRGTGGRGELPEAGGHLALVQKVLHAAAEALPITRTTLRISEDTLMVTKLQTKRRQVADIYCTCPRIPKHFSCHSIVHTCSWYWNLPDTELIRYRIYQVPNYQKLITYHSELEGREEAKVDLWSPFRCRVRKGRGWRSSWAGRWSGDRGSWFGPLFCHSTCQEELAVMVSWEGREGTGVDLFCC